MKILVKVSSGKNVTIAMAVFLLFTILVLPYFARQGEEKTGTTRSPDTSFIYGKADLYEMAEILTPIFTFSKWIFLGLTFILLVVFALKFLVNSVNKLKSE